LKKYCVCYDNKTLCGDLCNCWDCHNREPTVLSSLDKAAVSSKDSITTKKNINRKHATPIDVLADVCNWDDAMFSFPFTYTISPAPLHYKPPPKAKIVLDTYFNPKVGISKYAAIRILQCLNKKELAVVSQVSRALHDIIKGRKETG
jgi:hypothetical protein